MLYLNTACGISTLLPALRLSFFLLLCMSTLFFAGPLFICPSYFCDCLQLYTPSRTLRSASNALSLQIPRTRLSNVFAPFTWNDLPLLLRQKPSLDSFKSNLKTLLFPKLELAAMFSLQWCCLHPSQVSVCCPF